VIERLHIDVPGEPQPQGSKRAVRDRAGNARLVEGGCDAAKKRLRSWREAVSELAALRYHGPPIAGPVAVSAVFRFPRPPSHWTRSGRLTAAARREAREKTSKPDLDKLLRAVLDSLTDARVIGDDAQVVAFVEPTRKCFCEPGDEGAEVRVFTLNQARETGGKHRDS